ncbi:MAG: PQQ-binding-like beta-propeller repeat protein [Polyangiaceae bacterium]
MYNHDVAGTRFAKEEHRLGPNNVSGLGVRWAFPTAGAVTGTPIVVGNRVYVGDLSGAFHALHARTGESLWDVQLLGPVSGSALVRGSHVIVGDLAGFVYGINRRTGALDWQVRASEHPWAAVYGSPTPVGDLVAIGVASNEWFAPAVVPGYPCCTFRGSVMMLDPADGRVVWQTATITPAEAQAGGSGAPVWSTPTYDPALDLLFVTTGNNYEDPGTSLSDSVLALDPATGAVVWSNQRYANDTWNVAYPPFPPHPDYDLGDSPQVYRLANGRKVVGAGQKSGFFHVLDAETGAEIATRQFQVAGQALGGMFADSAVAHGTVFANSSNYLAYGDVVAFSGDTSQELWRAHIPGGATLSGVAVANGVVYFAALDGSLYAVSAASGQTLARLAIGAATSGPSVSSGRVFVGTGNGLALFTGGLGPGSVVALGAGCWADPESEDSP